MHSDELHEHLRDFARSKLLRDPTTWLFLAAAGVYGGTKMYWIREAKRPAGNPVQWSSLAIERCVDFTAGAMFEIVIFLLAVFLLAGYVENLRVWWRQTLLVATYLGFVLLGRLLY